ncbi:MAG: hypothetical protein LIO91_03540 [Bacteroidales bacterium]|nr:hypothetical protein [Bacteroidales bacterium]
MNDYTQSEIDIMRQMHAQGRSHKDIADALGRPLQSVSLKLSKIGCKHLVHPATICISDHDREWLRANYPHTRNDICVMVLGISHATLHRWARRLRLRKTQAFMTETQLHTAACAKASHLRNGTYPPKGVVNPNLARGEQYRFKPKSSTTNPKQS